MESVVTDTPSRWFLISINAVWGAGYLSWNESKPYSPYVHFGSQPIGVREENLERIMREFPDAKLVELPPII